MDLLPGGRGGGAFEVGPQTGLTGGLSVECSLQLGIDLVDGWLRRLDLKLVGSPGWVRSWRRRLEARQPGQGWCGAAGCDGQRGGCC